MGTSPCFPQPGRYDLPGIRRRILHFFPEDQRLAQHSGQLTDVLFYLPVGVIVGMEILVLLLLRVDKLVILLHRMLQDPFRIVQTAVPVHSAAEFSVPLLFLGGTQPGFSVVQFHITVHFGKRVLVDDDDLLLFRTFFLSLCVLIFALLRRFRQRIHIERKLLQICFQRVLIHLLRQKILPGKFFQFLYSHRQDLFQCSFFPLKIRLHHLIIQGVRQADQRAGILRRLRSYQKLQPFSRVAARTVIRIHQPADPGKLKLSRRTGTQHGKLMIQQFLTGHPPDRGDAFAFLQQSPADRRLRHQRRGHLQRRLHRVAVNLFDKIKLIRFLVEPLCKRTLPDAVVQHTIFFSLETFHIRAHIHRIIPAHRPDQVPDPVLRLQTVFIRCRMKVFRCKSLCHIRPAVLPKSREHLLFFRILFCSNRMFRQLSFHQNTSPFDQSTGIRVIATSWTISFS